LIILGLAVATCEHHAAALVVDGQVVGAVEEERLNGVKHYGWHPPGRPGANLVNTPGLTLNDVLCRASVRWLLEPRGLTLADVDLIAVNGIPNAYLGARECVRVDRYVYVPHHTAHAALAARTSPWSRCNVLTVDGRGEYETAAWFTYRDGELRRRAELPAGEGRSIGGVYETVTRVLGFGPHGQGQTMALAAFGDPDAARLAEAYRVESFERYALDEARLQTLASARAGSGGGVMNPEAWALAADVQAATEQAVLALARAGQAEDPDERWAIAGGVALNCCANSALRDGLGVEVWVPSAAHDAGTALGCALEAAHLAGEPACGPLRAAGLGPDIGDDAVDEELSRAGLRPVATSDPTGELVARLMDGRVIGFVSGGLEFGPRALGHRSIIAHPGLPGIQDRVNAVKDRQNWRPFGPSVLAERAEDWFEDAQFGPFMTFTARVRAERRESVAAVVHVDGTTRPQAVESGDHAPWRGLLEAFERATGIPMILNTSFNGRDEPIVRGAAEAIASARRIGLDGLWLDGRLVDLRGPRG
jgi:predicted NodU family carbamoyl transferase